MMAFRGPCKGASSWKSWGDNAILFFDSFFSTPIGRGGSGTVLGTLIRTVALLVIGAITC